MTKHKHYYAIRAFADGWKIESKGSAGWEPTVSPFFSDYREYRVTPDENGWLPWYGGECPVDPDTDVEIITRGNLISNSGKADDYTWNTTITAYRVIKEEKVDPYAELKAAAKDPTKEVWLKATPYLPALSVLGTPQWNFPPEEYEIRNKPTKMKLRAWVYLKSGNLAWKKEGHSLPSEWKRVPSEDKEIEVEE